VLVAVDAGADIIVTIALAYIVIERQPFHSVDERFIRPGVTCDVRRVTCDV
jgi:hypothetical protein